MPLVLLGVLGGIVALGLYEVYVAGQPLSALVPWWHPSVGPALGDATVTPETQRALADQAAAQAAIPPPPAGPHIVPMPFAHLPPQPTPAPHVATFRLTGLGSAAAAATLSAWQSKVRSTVATIQSGLGLYQPNPTAQLQREILTSRLSSISGNPTKANLQSNVVAMMAGTAGPDANAAAAQLQPLLSSAPPNA